MLANPTYVGRIRYGELDVEGKHPPLIPGEVWKDVQKCLKTAPGSKPAARPRPEKQEYPYGLTGLVRDANGHAMTPATCKGKQGTPYPYYRCVGPNCDMPYRYVRADRLESIVCQHIAKVAYDPEQIRQMVVRYEDRIARIEARYTQSGLSLHDRLQACENRVRKLSDALILATTLPHAHNAILRSLHEEEAKADALRAEAKRMQNEINLIPGGADPDEMARTWANLANAMLAAQAAGARDPLLRHWLQAHIESVIIDREGRAAITVRIQAGSTSSQHWHPEREGCRTLSLPLVDVYLKPLRKTSIPAV